MRCCPSCATDVPSDHQFCGKCGAPVNGGGSPATKTIQQPRSSTPSSSSNIDEGRFPPGTMLAQRYRIVSLLGRGGMGEVYRANDLLLGQPVALKFLPAEWTSHEPTLARFRNEVRIARQISHPNVCRVYDIGEAEGSTYLSMEYVDGEDLASLLRRIGRLPPDKALQIARQLCAGLAAAHDKGVVHRDLKPGNIMLDGQGQLRITDFGLAGVASEVKDIRSGTPAYMAPEQRSGQEVTARSDIYALGMVLHEIFTGSRSSGDLSHPDLSPEVDRVIRRCLAEDPTKRPASTLAVSAALPGGDPLAAALAAGETPSPEMVAAAGDTDSISVRTIVICAALVLAGLVAAAVLGAKTNLLTKTPFPKPPAVLEQKAQDVIQSLGYTEPPTHRADGFRYATEYQRYAEKQEKRATYQAQLANGQPPLVYFWYRQSPQNLEAALEDRIPDIVISIISPGNPTPTRSGMVNLNLDAQGRLIEFSAVPPQVEESPVSQSAPDWTPLLAAAGLDMTRFTPAEPHWLPLVSFDTRAAWTGSYAQAPEVPMRIEAASWRGRPVNFQVIGPWSKPERMDSRRSSLTDGLGATFFLVLLVLSAWRNAHLGRGDIHGATRLAAFIWVVSMLWWVCRANHVPTAHEVVSIIEALFVYFVAAARSWMFYVALEPYVRRRWPQIMVTWSRLLGGGIRDSLVGGHLLIGGAFGVGFAIAGFINRVVGEQSGELDTGLRLDSMLDARHMTSVLLGDPVLSSVFSSLILLLLLFLFRAMFRRLWLPAAAVLIVIANLGSGPLGWVAIGIGASLFTFILTRFGVLAMMAALFVAQTLLFYPLTTDLTAWYAGGAVFAIASVLALTGYALYTALGGRPIWKAGFLDSD